MTFPRVVEKTPGVFFFRQNPQNTHATMRTKTADKQPEREEIMLKLPKNVMQIGQSNPHCKVYVEDYVHTFLKQRKKEEVFLAFGKREEVDGVSYYLIYGAEKKTDWDRGSLPYFKKFDRLGTLEGTCDRRVFKPLRQEAMVLDGYFVFYEQNEDMQSYMITVREKEDMQQERETEKEPVMEAVRVRRESNHARKGTEIPIPVEKKMKERKPVPVPAARSGKKYRGQAVCAVLALIIALLGAGTVNGGLWMNTATETAGKALEQLKTTWEEKNRISLDALLDEKPATEDGSFLIIEETQLAEEEIEGQEVVEVWEDPGEIRWTIGSAVQADVSAEPETSEVVPGEEAAAQTVGQTESEETAASTRENPEPSVQERVRPESYVVERGDNLAEICRRFYGDTSRMYEICRINNIADPNQIQRGQKILLP